MHSWVERKSCTIMVNHLFVIEVILCCSLCTGVSHLTVPDDLTGVMAILNWLAFVPKVSIQWQLIV